MFNFIPLGGFEKLNGAYLLPPNKLKKKKEKTTEDLPEELAKEAEFCAIMALAEQRQKMAHCFRQNDFGGGWRPY